MPRPFSVYCIHTFINTTVHRNIVITNLKDHQASREQGQSASRKKRCRARHEIRKRGGGQRSRRSRAALMVTRRSHRPDRPSATVRSSEEKIQQIMDHLLCPLPDRPAATTADRRISPSCHHHHHCNRRTTAAAIETPHCPEQRSS